MAFKAIYHPYAELEFDEALAYYSRAGRRVTGDFQKQLQRAEDGILESPTRWRIEIGVYRMYVMAQFPYSVFYDVRGELVRIIAIAHQHRDQYYWINRRFD